MPQEPAQALERAVLLVLDFFRFLRPGGLLLLQGMKLFPLEYGQAERKGLMYKLAGLLRTQDHECLEVGCNPDIEEYFPPYWHGYDLYITVRKSEKHIEGQV